MLGSAGESIAQLARGLWRGGSEKRWLIPLAVFLCVTGLLLILAASVEASFAQLEGILRHVSDYDFVLRNQDDGLSVMGWFEIFPVGS